MSIIPMRLAKEKGIAAAVKRAERKLKPDVVWIRFNLGFDWTGDPSVFFRIVLSDEACMGEERFRVLRQRVQETLRSEFDEDELALLPYFNYRSLSEQTEMKERAWA
jgi:hypothetical protein